MKTVSSLAAVTFTAAIALPAATAFAPSGTFRSPKTTILSATSVTADKDEANPRLSGLALALDDGTRKSHSMAENTAFVQGFFKGISSPDSYKNLLTSLYYVYRAMEVEVMDAVASTTTGGSGSSASSEDAKWIQALDAAPLRRLPGLEKDMEFFYGPQWRETMAPPSKGTEAYVGRIRELVASVEAQNTNETTETSGSSGSTTTSDDSLLYLFVAHQYTRYLGDLFGGQMMGNMASRSMDLPSDGSGVAFYTFENVPSTKDFITEWYTTLNDLGVSPAKQQAIVDEANLVFSLNIGILEELEGSPWAALWAMAVKSAQEFTDWTNIKESKNGK